MFAKGKIDDTLYEFIYQVINVYKEKSKWRFTEQQNITINLKNYIKDGMEMKLPINILFCIGACFGFINYPKSESRVHAGMSYNMRMVCSIILKWHFNKFIDLLPNDGTVVEIDTVVSDENEDDNENEVVG